jgi:TolB protein
MAHDDCSGVNPMETNVWENMRTSKIVNAILLAVILMVPSLATAQIRYIDLTNPFLRKIPMAIPVFSAMTPSSAETQLVESIADQLSGMLDFTGYFKMLDRNSFLFDPRTGGISPETINYGNWKTVGAEMLITGGTQVEPGGTLVLEMRLYDTFKANVVVGKRYRGPMQDQRTMIRRFCAEVIQALTGRAGIFDSQFAFISNGTGNKEIYLCDFDGANIRQLTNKRSITTSPSWSWDGRHLAYTSFARGPSQIYVRDMQSGAETRFTFPGVQIAPMWAPGRFELAASLSMRGDEEIYLLTGGGKMIKRVTESPGIDVEATWSPDGKMMAFTSKRAGTPQIFIQDVNGDRVRRLTFQGRYNTQPSWSPKGDKIAYSSLEAGQLNIYVIDVEGNNPIRLTYNQGENEAPTWAPDGSLISFSSTREGKSRIYIMTAFGTDQRRLLVLPGEQRAPKWSPNISP